MNLYPLKLSGLTHGITNPNADFILICLVLSLIAGAIIYLLYWIPKKLGRPKAGRFEKVKNTVSILTLAILCSCNLYERRKEVFMTDEDFVENFRELSPDSSMVLINYSLDLGAFGCGQAGTAILKLSDTTKNLRDLSLPNTMKRIRWLDNQNISAQFDILPSLRSGERIKLKDEEINNVKIRISPLDYIEKDAHWMVVHKETSPNGQLELVAYRYLKDRSNLNILHLSIIKAGEKIPKYGNFLIADSQSDYVMYATWTKNNELQFYSNSLNFDLIQYYLVDNRPKINYKIVIDDKKFQGRYRWTEKGSM